MQSSTRKSLWSKLLRIWPLYVLLLPGLVYLLIFCYGPMYGAIIAFKDYSIAKGILGSPFVGLKWFVKFVTSYNFTTLVANTLRVSLYSLVVNSIIRVVLSLSINTLRQQRLKQCIQTITYLPHFISTVVMVGILIRFFNPSFGAISKLIQLFGGTDRDLMGIAKAVPHIYVWSGVWQNAGWSTILFISALTAVDVQLHEAAIVDGATIMQRIFHIDLPTLIPTIVICLILDCGNIMNVGHTKMLLMQNNLNKSTTEIISTYVYNIGMTSASPKYSYATAIGLINSVVNFVLVVLVNGICRRLNETSLW